jgi:putative membrane protein
MTRLALPLALLAQPALADPEGYDHMMNWGYGYGPGMMFGPVLWLIVLGLIVAGVVWFVRRMDGQSPDGNASSALAELDMRFARGDIDAEDYAARKKLLGS